ncbi:MAG: hypothetical protein F6K19_00180 [Cyanothece sp. SIO1E1]|nr:hypothetical protein [Cyanothece sp. SIO1E1]
MLQTISAYRSSLTVQHLLKQVMESGKLSRQEHFHLTWAMLSGNQSIHENRHQLNRVLESIQTGGVELVDYLD